MRFHSEHPPENSRQSARPCAMVPKRTGRIKRFVRPTTRNISFKRGRQWREGDGIMPASRDNQACERHKRDDTMRLWGDSEGNPTNRRAGHRNNRFVRKRQPNRRTRFVVKAPLHSIADGAKSKREYNNLHDGHQNQPAAFFPQQNMVPLTGFEPAAFCSGGRRSIP